MRKFKRIIAMFVCIVMLACATSSCLKRDESPQNNGITTSGVLEGSETSEETSSEETTSEETTTETQSPTTPDPPATPADEIANIPNIKFDGRQFTMMLRDNSAHSGAKDEFFVGEELSPDFNVLEKAVFTREQTLETKLGIEFVYSWSSNSDSQYTLFLDTAGLNLFDVCGIDAPLASGLIIANRCYNWADLEHLGLDKVWWGSRSGMANELTINDELYMITGDASILTQGKSLAMFFNKTLLPLYTDYDPDDIYEIVNNGGWTIDFYLDLTKNVIVNLNDDYYLDENDLYGNDIYISTITQGYISAFDIDIIENTNGYYSIGLDSQNTKTACEKLYELCYQGNRTYLSNVLNGDKETNATFFMNGHALFTHGGLEWAPQYLTEMANDYGVLPYPKLNAAQEKYGSMLSSKYTAFLAPISTSDTEFLGIVMESLASESYFSTTPAYYDSILKNGVEGNADDLKMLKLIHDCIDYNAGFLYATDLANPHNIFNAILRPEDPAFNSYDTYWQRKGDVFQPALNALLEFYGIHQTN